MKHQLSSTVREVGLQENVLVGVVRSRRDLAFLTREHWYRIPVTHLPVRPFRYIALYQPAFFGREGRCIRYYAPVVRRRMRLRVRLLPDEPQHPRARERYLEIRVGAIRELPHPIRNRAPRRVSFGFTSLDRLFTVRNMLALYKVPPTEELTGRALRRAGIRVVRQYRVSCGAHRYRLDFAVLCRRASIAIECDNRKAHAGARQRARDRMKDATLTRHGWRVIRLTEQAIVSDMPRCIACVRKAMRACGGQ